MAHFSKINENNFVTNVIVISNDDEKNAEKFISEELGLDGVWIKTSYNTRRGIHYDPNTNQPSEDQSKAFRKNYGTIGYYFDKQKDAFIPPKPFESWILNEETCWWEPPIPRPEEGIWIWNEEIQNWEEVNIPEE